MKTTYYILMFLFASLSIVAQSNTGIGTKTPDASAMLEIQSTNKGLLPPRVSLTATNATAPITAPATGLLVYNIAAAGTTPNNVVPGYYYWDATVWKKLATPDYWSLTGNANTAPGTNFIGTTDAQQLNFKVNGLPAGKIGLSALSGSFFANTYFGLNAGAVNAVTTLPSASTAYNNVGVGYNALAVNTTGNTNVAIGSNALASNTYGGNNVAIGDGALQANNTYSNVAVGYRALNATTGRAANTAVGVNALTFNVNGQANTALGASALRNNNGGSSDNTALGNAVLSNNTSGISNTAIGSTAMINNISGSYNIALGPGTLNNSSTGGNYNTMLGYYAGSGTTTGSNNIVIGSPVFSGGNGLVTSNAASSNEMNIGNTLFGTGVNTTIIGLTSTGKIGINTRTPVAAFQVNGSQAISISSVNGGASYSVALTDYMIIVTGSGTATVTLPLANTAKGRVLIIKSMANSANNALVNAAGSDTIDGGNAITGVSNSTNKNVSGGTTLTFVSDGVNTWYAY